MEDEVRNRMEALAKKYDLKFEEEDNFEMDGTFVVCASAPISYEDAETLISAPEFSPECTDDGACIFRGQTKEQVVQMIRDACE